MNEKSPSDELAVPPGASKTIEAPVISIPDSPQIDRKRTTTVYESKTEIAFLGPLPPPAIYKAYDDVLPGSADRLLRMAENQQTHRIKMEDTVVVGNDRRAEMGLYLGFAICVLIVIAAAAVAFKGHTNLAGVFLVSTLLQAGGLFIYGRESQKKERETKAKTMGEMTQPAQGIEKSK